ncbi:MAG: hypothetical protein HYZ34_12840 [Ignavibacteriae bacterium]|nr:hypothetical protein [Ignavibacteriota bacterium]
MTEEQDKQKNDEGTKKIIGKVPLRESYSPDKDDLDPKKPPQGSGVPPKDSDDKKSKK